MQTDIQVKICGLKQAADVNAAVAAGARYIGLNFFEKSPRYVTLAQAALLAELVPPGVARIALTVDAGDDFLTMMTDRLGLDMLQLHGSETPERVADIRARFGLPVMKAVGIGGPDDLAKIALYGRVADQLLVDARPAKNARLPGGNGLAFDWQLLTGQRWPVPWMLAGGLTAENVAGAIKLTGARQVDVSSGVETTPGTKDAGLIRDFIAAARSALP